MQSLGMKELKFSGLSLLVEIRYTLTLRRTQAVRDWPVPTTATALRGFLGLGELL